MQETENEYEEWADKIYRESHNCKFKCELLQTKTDEGFRINELKCKAINSEYCYGQKPSEVAIVNMHPKKFLSLTPNGDMTTPSVVDKLKRFITEGKEIPLPFLDIDKDTYEVVGHEGRNRMKASGELYISEVPVALMFYGKGNTLDYFSPTTPPQKIEIDRLWRK
jgi:hypothetical protein